MRQLTFCSILICALSSAAQDWALLNPAYKYNYSNDGTDTISNQIFVTGIDTLGPDSFLYHLNRFGVVCDTCPASLGGPCDGCYVRIDQPQFLGLNCTRSGNDWFLNDLDTFLIKSAAGVGTSWTFEPNSGVTATVVSNLPATVFGLPDSVGRIALSTGDTLVLSRSFGLLNFPHAGIPYGLLGVEGADVGVLFPDPLDYFDFQVGDELTYEVVSAYWFPMTSNAASISDFWSVRIEGRSDVGDSVVYSTSFAMVNGNVQNGSLIGEPVWPLPIGSWHFGRTSILLDHPIIGSYPGMIMDTSICWVPGNSGINTGYVSTYRVNQDGRRILRSHAFNLTNWGEPLCGFDFDEELQPGLHPSLSTPVDAWYEEGLGLRRVQYRATSGVELRVELVGAIIDGDTVLQAPSITWNVGLEEPAHSKYSLTPNPSKDSFTVTSAEIGATVRLHDIRGRLLRSVHITTERQLIDIADMDIGIYLVRLDGSAPQRLIIAR